MRCVVTGAAGFIGSALTRRLILDGHDVRVVDLASPDIALRKKAWMGANERMLGDLRRPDVAAQAVDGCDWVFHLAADVGGVGYLAAHDYRPFFNNMRMSMNMLDACEAAGVDRFFYTSSTCIYPVEAQHRNAHDFPPLDESIIEQGTPDLMYGREKLMTLRLCERAPFDARVGIMNTIFGPGLKLEGERMKFPAAITTRAIRAVKNGGPLEIWGDGSQVRGYFHVEDAVDKIVRIMTEPYEGPVNVTSREVASCIEVARMVLDILDADVPLRFVDGPTGPMHRHVSNEKWERVYGPDTSRTMRQAFEDFVEWVKCELPS